MKMAGKLRLAIARGATCSGGDVEIVDINERLLQITEIADLVYAAVIMDTKLKDVDKWDDGSIDITFHHGAIRDSENEHIARLFRRKSKILISFGSCSCYGGIPGLANITDREGVFREVFSATASTVNPDSIMPLPEWRDKAGHILTLPSFYDEVLALDDVVPVDYYLPGCPPLVSQINQALDLIVSNNLPPKGAVLASEKTLCDECKRTKPERITIEKIYRPHEIELDPEKCFLEQGVICLGPATRAGCGAKCIEANMPCRGCLGATSAAIDQGGSMLSAITSILAISENETQLSEKDIEKLVSQVKDPLGTFYRFSMPKSLLRRAVKEVPK
jgi:F420-non-reducing hydrogenase small subunit